MPVYCNLMLYQLIVGKLSPDFLSELPTSHRGTDVVLLVVDKLSKRAIFIPTSKTVTAPDVLQLFVDNVFTKRDVPTTIISDRDPIVSSKFWRESMDINLNMSTAGHLETDGQSEAMVRVLSDMLRVLYSVRRTTGTCTSRPSNLSIMLPKFRARVVHFSKLI